jgi:hypothetical protein
LCARHQLVRRQPGWHACRVRDKQRPRYGFYVDHILDSFGTLFLIGGLGLSGYMSGTIALAL